MAAANALGYTHASTIVRPNDGSSKLIFWHPNVTYPTLFFIVAEGETTSVTFNQPIEGGFHLTYGPWPINHRGVPLQAHLNHMLTLIKKLEQ